MPNHPQPSFDHEASLEELAVVKGRNDKEQNYQHKGQSNQDIPQITGRLQLADRYCPQKNLNEPIGIRDYLINSKLKAAYDILGKKVQISFRNPQHLRDRKIIIITISCHVLYSVHGYFSNCRSL